MHPFANVVNGLPISNVVELAGRLSAFLVKKPPMVLTTLS
jgi:hypothetical protein